ncbi:hypothetical protein BC937DRAFT_90323 [Endogone sp. FLAS-F59071]|nr:hypothetical protein BC937DRAFT_90323 [Endogone sp. FLAS-F59071]|eukprot:RUS17161.1 hypothetical protein BC937DRAFT_90323 [Endogone sp. FLAS-F59071]
MNRQLEVHKYCAHLTDGIYQRVIHDTPRKGARFFGIETRSCTITWYSNAYAIKDGFTMFAFVTFTQSPCRSNFLVVSVIIKCWHISFFPTWVTGLRFINMSYYF